MAINIKDFSNSVNNGNRRIRLCAYLVGCFSTTVYPNGTRKELLSLSGTIPVHYKGSVYNIPVCIWLMDTHPYSSPIVYVKPTKNMLIRVGPNVKSDGKVDLPYLREWRYPSSDLLGLLQIMTILFGEETPLYTRSYSNEKPRLSSGVSPSYPSVTSTADKATGGVATLKVADLKGLKYGDPEMACEEVLNLLRVFPTLKSEITNLVVPPHQLKTIVQITGNISVLSRGIIFPVPVNMTLMPDFPECAPIVYVTAKHVTNKNGSAVDTNGLVDIPYIKDWLYTKICHGVVE